MENKTTQTTKILMAAAVAGIMGAFTVSASFADDTAPKADAAKTDAKTLGKCDGANSCKGKSECSVAGANQCSGKNTCAGKGWTKMTEAKCTAWAKKAKKEAKWEKM